MHQPTTHPMAPNVCLPHGLLSASPIVSATDMHSSGIRLVLGHVSWGVGDDVRQALACQVNTALLEQRENLGVDEGIPTGPALGEVGILLC